MYSDHRLSLISGMDSYSCRLAKNIRNEENVREWLDFVETSALSGPLPTGHGPNQPMPNVRTRAKWIGHFKMLLYFLEF